MANGKASINRCHPDKIRTNIYFEETAMTIANVDYFGRDVRSAIRHHWVLFLIPGIVMAILGLLAAAAPFIATPVVETFAGWLFLTGGFVGLAALFTTRNVPGFVWTLLSAVLAILIGAFLVWRPFAGLVTLTVALAAFFAVHGIVQILTALDHRALFARSWPWMALGLLIGINLFMSGLALVMTAIACRSVNDASEKAAPVGRTT
jgi:uncharacterized membrane protein HdeD (DUF308 family)